MATLFTDAMGSTRTHKPALPSRGMTRGEAVAYTGYPPGVFDVMVKAGVLPDARALPLAIVGRKRPVRVWDRFALDDALDRLAGRHAANIDERDLDRAFGITSNG